LTAAATACGRFAAERRTSRRHLSIPSAVASTENSLESRAMKSNRKLQTHTDVTTVSLQCTHHRALGHRNLAPHTTEQQRRRSTALSSKCGQCHVDGRGTRLNSELLFYNSSYLAGENVSSVQHKPQATFISTTKCQCRQVTVEIKTEFFGFTTPTTVQSSVYLTAAA